VKIRIGFGLGTQGLQKDGDLGVIVDALEGLGFDSLWLSERVTGGAPDPLIGLAFAAGRTTKLKLGTSVLVVPGRNPAVLAKELATLDVLSNGRLLPAVGLGTPDPAEREAFSVARGDRAAWFEEALPLMRRFWTEDAVDHEGDRFRFAGVSVRPRPVQEPIDVWLGGQAPSELRRTGRLGDGWLPSFCTAAEAAAGREIVEQSAADAGRSIDPEHFGALIPYVGNGLPDRVVAALAARRPGVDPAALVPSGHAGLRESVERFIASGVSKFVLVPVTEPASWEDELSALADALLPLQV
jgi:probable F420-dependent oxidoreductase